MTVGAKNEYSVHYSDMLGFDPAGDERHFSKLLNMYRDYTASGGEVLESIPGFRVLCELGEKINGIFFHSSFIIVHAGSRLYSIEKSELDSSIPTLILEGVNDAKSHAFTKGEFMYILDGLHLIRISKDGSAHRFISVEGYAPTTFKNGKPHEERNLISSYFSEKIEVSDPAKLTRRSSGLMFRKNSDGKSCTLYSTAEDISGEVYIPAYAYVTDELLAVSAIGDYAFYSRSAVTEIHLADGIETIGRFAFHACTSLRLIELSRSVRVISDGAFSGCTALTELYLGQALETLGVELLKNCDTSKLKIKLGMDSARFRLVENYSELSAIAAEYLVAAPKECFAFPIRTPCQTVYSLTVDGDAITEFSLSNPKSGEISREVFFICDASRIAGRELRVICKHDGASFYPYKKRADFGTEITDDASPIYGCTTHASFDGRIFLSGNPKYPDTVFYTSDTPEDGEALLFGSLSYFKVGSEGVTVRAMVPIKDALAVFYSSASSDGVFCHTPKSADEFPSREYPLSDAHAGFRGMGSATTDNGAAVFITDSGVFSLTRSGGYSSIKSASERISHHFFPDISSGAVLTVWQGYLTIAKGKCLLLGDPRRTDGHEKYEWYPVEGVCTYENDRRAFVYAHTAEDGYKLGPTGKVDRSATVYSEITASGRLVYYLYDGDEKIALMPSSERYGGSEVETTAYASDGELLVFGTENGELCVFNTDKRGIAPARIREQAGFDAVEYKKRNSRTLHPDFYAFGSHAASYEIMTRYDNAGAPHLAKSTVCDSTVVKLKAGSHLYATLLTDGSVRDKRLVFADACIDFSDIDFSRMSFETRDRVSVGVSDRTTGWVEKAVLLRSESFASPIGLYSISYRTKRGGRIKR